MAKKTSTHIHVEASNGLTALLLDDKITTAIAATYPAYECILLQIQRDLALKKDDELTLQVIKGLAYIDNYLKLFQAEGLADSASHKA